MFTRTMIAQELFMNVTDLIGDNALPISHGKFLNRVTRIVISGFISEIR